MQPDNNLILRRSLPYQAERRKRKLRKVTGILDGMLPAFCPKDFFGEKAIALINPPVEKKLPQKKLHAMMKVGKQ
jgi:hypothetical protein